LPTWTPSYEMKRSTILYTCNASGMHDVGHAIKFGVSDPASASMPISFCPLFLALSQPFPPFLFRWSSTTGPMGKLSGPTHTRWTARNS
jgi:hypothetical protein